MPPPRPRRRPLPILCVAAAIALLVGLGTWQIQRKAWKEGLIAAIADRYDRASTPLGDLPDRPADAGDLAFLHVTVDGRFRDAASFVVPRPAPPGAVSAGSLSQPGFGLLTFLDRADGLPVLVDRGWIPATMRESAPRGAGPVHLLGVVRAAPAPGWLTPDNVPADGIWYSIDPPAMAEAAGLGPVLPFYVALEAAPGSVAEPPIPPQRAVPTLRNEHLGYAVTWYGLAAALVAMLFVLRRPRA